jgi:hypothetical protein
VKATGYMPWYLVWKKDVIDIPGRLRRVENIAGSGESNFVAF